MLLVPERLEAFGFSYKCSAVKESTSHASQEAIEFGIMRKGDLRKSHHQKSF